MEFYAPLECTENPSARNSRMAELTGGRINSETMATHFSPAALKFLRGLARNNDREWFDPRKAIYEREIKEPMLALIGEINDSLIDFAPDHVRDPRKAMFRIYRDT